LQNVPLVKAHNGEDIEDIVLPSNWWLMHGKLGSLSLAVAWPKLLTMMVWCRQFPSDAVVRSLRSFKDLVLRPFHQEDNGLRRLSRSRPDQRIGDYGTTNDHRLGNSPHASLPLSIVGITVAGNCGSLAIGKPLHYDARNYWKELSVCC
jgi:hypothetical protein